MKKVKVLKNFIFEKGIKRVDSVIEISDEDFKKLSDHPMKLIEEIKEDQKTVVTTEPNVEQPDQMSTTEKPKRKRVKKDAERRDKEPEIDQ